MCLPNILVLIICYLAQLVDGRQAMDDVVKVDGLGSDLERFNGVYNILAGMMNDDAPVWRTVEAVADPEAPDGEPFYPQNRVGRGWGIRNGAMGAVRLPKILLVTIGAFVSAQEEVTLAHAFDAHRVLAA